MYFFTDNFATEIIIVTTLGYTFDLIIAAFRKEKDLQEKPIQYHILTLIGNFIFWSIILWIFF